eukprot:907664_1
MQRSTHLKAQRKWFRCGNSTQYVDSLCLYIPNRFNSVVSIYILIFISFMTQSTLGSFIFIVISSPFISNSLNTFKCTVTVQVLYLQNSENEMVFSFQSW